MLLSRLQPFGAWLLCRVSALPERYLCAGGLGFCWGIRGSVMHTVQPLFTQSYPQANRLPRYRSRMLLNTMRRENGGVRMLTRSANGHE